MNDKDLLFSEPYSEIRAFAFDEKVVGVFPDMIKRSVPGYDTILKGIAMLSMRYVTSDSNVFDLGASLGAVSFTIDQSVGAKGLQIYAVDNSEPMINGLKKKMNDLGTFNQITPLLQDISDLTIENASLIVSNFTIQFIPRAKRTPICSKIFDGLNDGGVFILSEKVSSSELLIDYYHGYKKINGYSDMEIAQKRQALEDSLKPDKLSEWLDRLDSVGFRQIEVWFRAFNFVSIVAIK